MTINPYTQSLDSIVDVVVEISPLAAPRPTFNQLLILGSTDLITPEERLQLFTNAADIREAGFAADDPEYLAALLYFAQSPAPDKLWLGRQDLTQGPIRTATIVAGGDGYKVGDILTIVQNEAEGATVRVLTTSPVASPSLSPSSSMSHSMSPSESPSESPSASPEALPEGEVTSVEIVSHGSGYISAAALATTVSPSGGTGCTITITAFETPLDALQECRAVNFEWYVGLALNAVKADHEEIALWAESATPSTIYAFTTADADVPLGTAENIFENLKAALYSRVIGQYSTEDNAIAAIMGYAMGQNTGLNNSAYTLKFKREVGIETEDLSSNAINLIEGNNGNLYLSYGNYYNIFEQGVMADGTFFDEKINIDMLVSDIQLGVMDLLYGVPKVPQTDAGVTQIIHAINEACELSVLRGFIAPGLWTGSDILNLKEGDILPKGYLVQAPAVATQSRADREARKSPPIYVAIKEAGAVHSVLIGVYVNR